jgi:integrase
MSALSPQSVNAELAKPRAKPAKIKHGGFKGLYLYVKNGRGFWVHQFLEFGPTKKNKAPHWHTRSKSLGSVADITPAAAVRAVKSFDVARHDGDTGKPLPTARPVAGDSFGEALKSYLDTHDKITGSTRSLAERFIPADFRAKPVRALTAKDVRDVLVNGSDDRGPLWTGPGPNRGNRLRLLMLGVFAAEGVRPNPAEWNAEGAQLPQLMPDGEKYEAKHHEAMPHAELPAFVATLKLDADAIEDRAGRLVILTALRRSEVLAAKWSEFDLQERVWIVPANRMKKRKPHAVPLTDEMIACLGEPGEPDAYVFTNKAGGPLSNSHAALDKTWMPNGFKLHGFRSTFADWASEQDHGRKFAEKVIDTALAHKLGDAVTRAYFRTPLFAARRELMEAWSKFATGRTDQ